MKKYLMTVISLLGATCISQGVIINDGAEFFQQQWMLSEFVWADGNPVQNGGVIDSDTGIVTATFFAQYDQQDSFSFDTEDNLRTLTSMSFEVDSQFNEFTLTYQPDVTFDESSYIENVGTLQIFDLQGNQLDSVTQTMRRYTFTQGNTPGQDSMTIRDWDMFLHGHNEPHYTNADVLAAVSDGGLRIAYTDVWNYYLVDTNGDSIITGVEEYIDAYDQDWGSPNDYDAKLAFQWEYTTAPEPSSIMLLGLGGLACILRRQR